MRVPRLRGRRRSRAPAARVRDRRPRQRVPARPACQRHRPAVPLRPAVGWEADMTQTARPYYVPVGNEEQVFQAAFRQGLSVMLKGPTGCGKTRFVEAMAFDLDRPL